jgi:hypothetical protein
LTDEKRERPTGTCILCKKEKPIFNHLNADQNAPLCGACAMRLRRESATTDQIKILKYSTVIISGLEGLLGSDLEMRHRLELQDMQDRITIMLRVWLGDEDAEVPAKDPFAADLSSSPDSDVTFKPDDWDTMALEKRAHIFRSLTPDHRRPIWESLTLNERQQLMQECHRAQIAAERAREAHQSVESAGKSASPADSDDLGPGNNAESAASFGGQR